MTNYDLQLWGMFFMGMATSAAIILLAQSAIRAWAKQGKRKQHD